MITPVIILLLGTSPGQNGWMDGTYPTIAACERGREGFIRLAVSNTDPTLIGPCEAPADKTDFQIYYQKPTEQTVKPGRDSS